MKNLTRTLATVAIIMFTGFVSNAQFSVIYNFVGTPDGSSPYGSLTLIGNKLYGMAENDGVNNSGCIYSIDTNGNGYKDLYDFSSAKGQYPYGSLTLVGKKLYGMTQQGGANALGVIFSIDTNGTGYKDIYDFPGLGGGAAPYGSLIYSGAGIFYGMSYSGGAITAGNIFTIDTDGTGYTQLFQFGGNIDTGANPYGDVVVSAGKLYGMTEWAGPYLKGNMFSINANGTGFDTLLSFNGTNGSSPYGSLTISGNKLFGLSGTVLFSVNTNGSGFKHLVDFTGPNGSGLQGSLTLSGNTLYGMTTAGGANSDGVIFSVDTNGSRYKKLLDFNGTNGSGPGYSRLTISGKELYGTAVHGGTNGYGVIFKLDTNNVATSIDQITSASEAINVYPNPAKNNVNIHLQNPGDVVTLICLYTITGQQIMEIKQEEKQNIQISTGNLANGTYLLKVVLADGNSYMNKIAIMK